MIHVGLKMKNPRNQSEMTAGVKPLSRGSLRHSKPSFSGNIETQRGKIGNARANRAPRIMFVFKLRFFHAQKLLHRLVEGRVTMNWNGYFGWSTFTLKLRKEFYPARCDIGGNHVFHVSLTHLHLH